MLAFVCRSLDKFITNSHACFGRRLFVEGHLLLLLLLCSALSGHISIIVFQLPPSDTHIIFCFDFTRNISTGAGGRERKRAAANLAGSFSVCVALWDSLEARRIGFAHSTRQSQQNTEKEREKYSYNGITIKTIFELNAPTMKLMMMILLPSCALHCLSACGLLPLCDWGASSMELKRQMRPVTTTGHKQAAPPPSLPLTLC